jgi:RHS repeat-associated protein
MPASPFTDDARRPGSRKEPVRTVQNQQRTRPAHPDGNYASYDYDGVDRVTAVRENGGSVVIAGYTYDDTGARTAVTHYGTSTTSYSYDAVGRLATLGHDLAGTSYDQSFTFTYNPAGQIVSRSGSNDNYAWTGHYNVNRGYTSNGLNQYTASGSASPTYDGNGNLTSDGTTSFAYDAENHLVSASGGHSATVAYDPLGRLWQLTSGSATTQFVHDGGVILDELTTGGTYIRRFAHGTDSDEPIGWYEGTNAARAPLTDERGTAIAFSDSSGNGVAIDTYDEYGIPRSSNVGRFQYTGQAWLSELGLFYYKARFYSPTMGRFMQTDPIGYGDGLNAYRYASSDPVDLKDPTGLLAAGCRDVPGSRIIDCSARDAARDLVQRELSGWTEAGQDAAVNAIGNYLTGESDFDTVALHLTNISTVESAVRFTSVSSAGGEGKAYLERTWIVSGISTFSIIQHIVSDAVFSNGTPQHKDFYEGWERRDGKWTYGDTDLFYRDPRMTSFTVTATAYLYPGVLPGAPRSGRDSQSGFLPSWATMPTMSVSPIGPPVTITWTSGKH